MSRSIKSARNRQVLVAAAAGASFLLGASAASADIAWDFSYSGTFTTGGSDNASGQLITTNAEDPGGTAYTIIGVIGTDNGQTISGLVPEAFTDDQLYAPDQLYPLDDRGFALSAGNALAIFSLVPGFVIGDNYINGNGGTESTGTFSVSQLAQSSITWNNHSGNNLWDLNSSNWTEYAANTTFVQADNVTFNDSNGGAGNYAVTVNTAVFPSSFTVNNSSGNYTFSGTGSIDGYGTSLLKEGTGTVTLGGSGDNSGLGAVVQSGALILAKASSSTVHAIGGPLQIDSGATLQLAGTGGDQIYDGATVTNNGTFDLAGQSEAIQGLNGTGSVINSSFNAATLTVGAGSASSYSSEFTGSIAGAGAGLLNLNVTGSGTFTLAGSTDNSYLGAEVFNGATLVLAKSSSSSVHAIGGPLTIDSGATAQLQGSGGDQIYDAVTVTDNGTLDLNGQNEGFAVCKARERSPILQRIRIQL